MLVRQVANPIKAAKKLQDREVTLKSTQKTSVIKMGHDGSPSTFAITEQLVEKYLLGLP